MEEIKNTVAMLNMKGGVSKTTLAVNLAGALAKLWNYRILLVDLDPQYNATQYLVNLNEFPEYVEGKEPTVLDILGGVVGGRSVIDGTPIGGKREPRIEDLARNLYENERKGGRLDLIPSTLHLINVEGPGFGKEHLLQNFINKVKRKYNLILIDCPPTFSVFLLSGYLASDYYLVPLKPDPLSTLGISLLEKVLEAYAPTYNKSIEPLGVVFTMVRDTREMSNVKDTVRRTSAGKRYIFRNSMSYATAVAEASRKNVFLFEYNRSWKQGEEIKQITKELIRLIPEGAGVNSKTD